MARYDIITVGSATVDVFAHTEPAELLRIHGHTDIAYPLGAKILVKELNFMTGGGGTNTAVAFARLGFRTAYLGRVGDDENGKIILDELVREHVDFIGKRHGMSGYSVVLDSVASDRTIFAYKGCNNDFNVKDVRLHELDASWLYFSSMIDKGYKALLKIASHAHKKGIKIAFNPSLYLASKGKRYHARLLKKVDVLIFNKEEAQALLGTSTENIFHLLESLSRLGPKVVAITDGHNGASCYDSSSRTFYSAKPQHEHIVETTGAGDAFASGFVAGMMKHMPIEDCLKLGMLEAESVIAALGAKNVLLGHSAFAKAAFDRRPVIRISNQ